MRKRKEQVLYAGLINHYASRIHRWSAERIERSAEGKKFLSVAVYELEGKYAIRVEMQEGLNATSVTRPVWIVQYIGWLPAQVNRT